MADNTNHFLDGPGLSRVWSKIKAYVKGNSSLVGAKGTVGTVKNNSSITNATGYTACPIVGGVPYYKDTNNTYSLVGAKNTTGLIKNGSDITSASGGYTPCPIVGGVPYYLNTNTTYNPATENNNGLMTSNQVRSLNNAFHGVSRSGVTIKFQRVGGGTEASVTLPNAALNTTGVVKTTSTVTSVTGLGYTACPIVGGIPYYKDTNTTYPVASGSVNGLMPSYMFAYVYNLGDIKNSATGTNVTYTTTSTSNSWVSAGSITVPQGIWIVHAVAQFPKVSSGTTRRYGFSLAASSANLDSTNVRRDMSDADCTGATYLQVTAFMNNSANAGLYFGIKSDPGVSGLEITIAYTMIRLK